MNIQESQKLAIEVAEREHGLYLAESHAASFVREHFTGFAIACAPGNIEGQWEEFVKDNIVEWIEKRSYLNE